MSVKMSDALRESINDINEILYAQKLIDKKNMNVLVHSSNGGGVNRNGWTSVCSDSPKIKFISGGARAAPGTSVSTISKWECGKNPIIPSVIVLMNVLDKHGLAVLM